MGSICPSGLAALAWEAAVKIERSEEYKTSAAILLADCKRRIDEGELQAGGVTWHQFCRVHLPTYSPSYLDRLILSTPGDQEDEKRGRSHSTDAFDAAWAAFVDLSPVRQREFLRCGVAYAVHPHKDEDTAAAPCDPSAPGTHALDYQV